MQKIRTLPDGSITIPRRDPEHEAALDAQFVRVGSELRWWPISRQSTIEIDELRDRFAGRRAIVLGKGPSLERLREVTIEDSDIVAAVNEAAVVKSPPRIDVALAVDAHVVASIAGKTRPSTLVLVPANLARDGVRPVGIGLWDDSLRPNMGASPSLVRLLALCGARQLVMVGFDGFDAPTRGNVYASSILAAGVADREHGNFDVINGQLAFELRSWAGDDVLWLHRQPKPRVKKGG